MWFPIRCPVRISVAAILLAGWFIQVNGWHVSACIFLAALIHELGHYVVLRFVGARITGVSVGILGAVLETDVYRLSYGRELASVLAGPLLNLAAALLCGAADVARIFSGASLILCVFNLLPIRPLDGGRAMQLLLLWRCGPGKGERLTACFGGVAGLLMAAGLGYLMFRTGGSLWLLPTACWMLITAVREFSGK